MLMLPTGCRPVTEHSTPAALGRFACGTVTAPFLSGNKAWTTRLVLLPVLTAVFAVVFLIPAGPWWAVDFQGILFPYQQYLRTSLLDGELPLWNPYASMGRPFLADPQAAALWPGSLVYLALGVQWGAFALTVLHAWLAVLATGRVAGQLGAERWAGLAAGLCFVLNAKLLGHLHAGHIHYVLACYALPVVVTAFLALHDEFSAGNLARLALAVAWQLLIGAPQIFWCTAVLVALLGGAFWLARPTRAGLLRLGRDAGAAALAYGWAALLAAALLLPLIELIGQSNRGASAGALSAVGPLRWTDWAGAFTLFSEPGRLKDYETMPYAGLLVTLLGLAGLLQAGDVRSRMLLLAAGAVVALAAAPGTPLHAWLLQALPGYGSFRIHARWTFALGWLLAVGAALFVSGTGTALTRRIALTGAGALGLGTVLLLYPSPLLDPGDDRNGWNLLPAGLLLCATVAGILGQAADPAVRRRGLLVAIAVATVELGSVLFLYKLGYPRSLARPWERTIAGLVADGQAAGRSPPPRAYFPRRIAWENSGMQLGFSSLFGYESLALIRPRSVVHWSMGVEPPDDTDFPAFAVLDQRLPWPVAQVGLQLGYDPERQTVIRRDAPDLERAWLARSIGLAADWREAGRLVAAGADVRQCSFIESPSFRGPLPAGAPAGTVGVTHFGRNRVELTVTSDQPALLVLAEPWYPGWTVRINGGKAEPALPVNGWMRGAIVPAGSSQVEFRFGSRWLPLGLLISVSACVPALWFGVRGARRQASRPS